MRELRRSDFLEVLQFLDDEPNINKVSDYDAGSTIVAFLPVDFLFLGVVRSSICIPSSSLNKWCVFMIHSSQT